jgi:hypothetical protein
LILRYCDLNKKPRISKIYCGLLTKNAFVSDPLLNKTDAVIQYWFHIKASHPKGFMIGVQTCSTLHTFSLSKGYFPHIGIQRGRMWWPVTSPKQYSSVTTQRSLNILTKVVPSRSASATFCTLRGGQLQAVRKTRFPEA